MAPKEALREELRDLEARRDYAKLYLNTSIALQIKVLRLQRGWTQEELGQRAGGMKQARICKVERADYSSWSISTLRKLAEAFDLALVVRFESFGTFLDDVTSLSRENLGRPSFEEDPAFRPRTVPTGEVSILGLPHHGTTIRAQHSVAGSIPSSPLRLTALRVAPPTLRAVFANSSGAITTFGGETHAQAG